MVAAGATFAAFPAWYATMFSGFYIALLLILVLLIVRAVSFEWRERGEDPRWRALAVGATRRELRRAVPLGRRALEPAARRAAERRRRLRRRPPRPLQPLLGPRRPRRGGALRLPRRGLPDPADDRRAARARRPRPGGSLRRRCWPALRRDGRRRRRAQRPRRVPAHPPGGAGRRRARAAVVLLRGAARGWAFVATASPRAPGRDAVHRALPARPRLQHGLREQPDHRRRGVLALRAPGHHRRRADPHSDRPPLPGLDLPRAPAAGGGGPPAPAEPCARSTRDSSAVRGRCGSCWPSTRRSAPDRLALVLAGGADGHVVAEAFDGASLADLRASSRPRARLRGRGASAWGFEVAGRRAAWTSSRSSAWRSWSGASARSRPRSTACRAARSRPRRCRASTRSRPTSPATCRRSCWPARPARGPRLGGLDRRRRRR